MEKLQLEILDDNRKHIFPQLRDYNRMGYLAGGTALALQLWHRFSYDFDVFCHKEIPVNFPAKVKKGFLINETLINTQDEFTFLTRGNVKVSFVFYPFDLKKYLAKYEDFPLAMLSPLGVALSKAYAISRRSSWRDYLDLYILLERKISSLKEIIDQAQKVYGEVFNEKLFLAQLVYTDDIAPGEVELTQLFSQKIGIEEVKLFFHGQIDEYLKYNQTSLGG